MKNKKSAGYYPKVRSQHPTHDVLRTELPKLPFRSVVRMGSTTVLDDTVSVGGNRVECNTVQAVKNSANKRLMKDCFSKNNVRTASWCEVNNLDAFIRENKFPIVIKHIYGSRGTGNFLIKSQEELNQWKVGKELNNFICEKFHNYNREYRLHITKDGCFYTCRKLLKENTPQNKRWFRNDSNCTWIVEENQQFDKPRNWGKIQEECMKALASTGLDVGACDVKVQSTKDEKGRVRENPDFIVIEINSAPSYGRITAEKYLQEIPKILTNKHKK